MAHCSWAHLCDYAFYDDSNKICIIGIFEVITVPKVPATHTRAVVAMEIKGQPNETVQGQIKVLRPDGGELFAPAGPIHLSPRGHAQFVLAMDNLTIPDFGPYEVRIIVNGELSKVLPFEVTKPPR